MAFEPLDLGAAEKFLPEFLKVRTPWDKGGGVEGKG